MRDETSLIMLRYIIIFLIIITIKKIGNFKCGADQLKIKPGILKIHENKKKRRLDSEYKPLKIKIDFSSFEKPDSMNEETFNYAKQLIDDTALDFEKFLKIKHTDYNITGQENEIKSRCNIKNIDKDYGNFLIENDLVIFPLFYPIKETASSAAKHCLINSDFRPIFGVLYINQNLAFTKKNTELYIKYLLLHEITHILIFSPDLLSKLGMTRILEKDDGSKIIYVNSPKVLQKSRQHFNCGTINGIPLESQGESGSAGSHWEARYMLGDYMISIDYIDNVLSDITLALFEDSGFYKVEYYSGGLFKFGKNKGCDFINKKCIKNEISLFRDEFCSIPNQPMCSTSRINKGKCIIYNYENEYIPMEYQYFENSKDGGLKYANYCPISNIKSSNYKDSYYPTNCKSGSEKLDSIYGETIGENSFCFISSLLPSNSIIKEDLKTICYKVECNKNKKEIVIHIGSSIINCPTFGGIISDISGFKGEIHCPKYYDICNFNNEICNDLFDCINKKVKTDEDSYAFEGDNTFINYKEIKSSAYNNKFDFYLYIILFLLLLII